MNWLQYPGVLLALVGTWLVGEIEPRRRQAGFLVYIVANAVLATWLATTVPSAWGGLSMYAIFSVLNLRGWWKAR